MTTLMTSGSATLAFPAVIYPLLGAVLATAALDASTPSAAATRWRVDRGAAPPEGAGVLALS